MKIAKRIVAAAAALALTFSPSCSILSNMSADGTASGIATGIALYKIYKALNGNNTATTAQSTATTPQTTNANTLDLSNVENLINLGQILTGAGTLQNATTTYTNQFSNGLIDGSSNLVNNDNVSSIIGSLLGLNNIDTSALVTAAANAAITAAANSANTNTTTAATTTAQTTQTTTQPVTTSTTGVAETLNTLTSIFNLFK